MLVIDFSISTEQLLKLANANMHQAIDTWEKKIWQFIIQWYNQEDSISVYTSGSTGKPKQINHSKSFMLNSAGMTTQAIGLNDCKTSLLCLPADKISGMMMIVRSICNQMQMYCSEPSANPLKSIQDDTSVIDFAAFTPMQFHSITNNYQDFIRAEKIRKILLGGEGISPLLAGAIRQMNNEIYSTFGMTETISHIALRKLSGIHISSSYKTLPGISISTTGNNCLVIDAPQLGVKNLITNDIVHLLSDREFEWQGRTDHVINTGGIKLHPEQIEELLLPWLQTNFFIAGTESEMTGQQVILCLEKRTLSISETEEIKTGLQQLNAYSRPREIWLIPSFAKTGNGKLNRQASLEMVLEKILL